MANQVITVDANHDDLAARNPGENITVNSGATLTVDSQPQETAMGILGDIAVNDGEIHFDGTTTFELSYDGGAGALPVVGDVVDNLTQAGTAKVTRIHAGAGVVTGTLTVSIQSGAFADNDSLDFNAAAWTAAVNGALPVGYMRVFGEDQLWAIFGLATFRCTGAEYELGTGDGTDLQSFTLPHNGVQHCIWIETGSGTGVYEKWARTHDSMPLTDFGVGLEGNVYSQTLLANTVTFGTSAAGGAPANGARLWIPNIHFATSNVGSPLVEIISTGTLNWEVQQNLSAAIVVDHTNWSTAELTLFGMRSAVVSTSCIPQKSTTATAVCGSLVQIDDCCLLSSPEFGSTVPLIFTDSPLGITIQDSLLVQLALTTTDAVNINTTINTTLRRCDVKHLSPGLSLGTRRGIEVNSAVDTVLEDVRVYSTNTLVVQSGSAGLRCENLSVAHHGTAASDSIGVYSGSSDVLIDGVSLVGRGPEDDFIAVADAFDVTVRNVGSAVSKVALGAQADHVFSISGFVNNVKMQRIYCTGGVGAQMVSTNNAGTGLQVINCGSDYNRELDLDNNNAVVRGCHCASGNINTTTGPEVDYSNVVGFNFYDVFGSDTTGKIGWVANPPGTLNAAHIAFTAGTPVYNNLGDALMRTVGDQITWTFPYLILGHTGFQNVAPQTAGTGMANINIEYAVDTGAGFGAWTAATGANLSAEVISPAGFRLRVRATTVTAVSSNRFNSVLFETTTTLADQVTNLYDITEPHTVNITGLTAGTDVIYIEDDTGAQQDFLTATATTHEFSYSGLNAGEDWVLVVKRPGAEPVRIPFTISESGSTLLAYVPRVLFRAAGAVMYTASTDALVTGIVFDLLTPQATIDIGDGLAPAQAVFDEFEVALVTSAGMAWLAQGVRVVSYDNLPAGEFLFLQDDIRLRRNLVGDVNAAVGAFVLSTQGTPIDGTNGSVGFVATSSGGGVADWTSVERDQIRFRLSLDGVQSDPTTGLGTIEDVLADVSSILVDTGTDIPARLSGIEGATFVTGTDSLEAIRDRGDAAWISADVSSLETDASAAARHATDVAEHDATQAALSALPAPLTAAEVNAEVDTALSDYDAPTAAELTAAVAPLALEASVQSTITTGGAGPWTTAVGFQTEASALARAATNQSEHDATQALVTALPVPLSAAAVNAEVDTALADYDGPTRAELTTDIISVLSTGGPGPWTQGAAGLVTANVTQVNGTPVVIGDFRADVSGLETEASAAARGVTNQAEHDATQVSLAGLPVPLTAAEVNSEVDTALADYDGPTRAELTTDIISVLATGGPGPWTTASGFSTHTAADVDTVLSATHGAGGWEGTETTKPHLGVGYIPAGTQFSLDIHAVRDGARVTPLAFALTFKDPADATVFSLTEASPGVVLGTDDVYRVTVTQALTAGFVYPAEVSVTDAIGVIGPRVYTVSVSA